MKKVAKALNESHALYRRQLLYCSAEKMSAIVNDEITN